MSRTVQRVGRLWVPGQKRRGWTPRDIPIYMMGAWFEADAGIATSGANITSARDLSGRGLDLTPDIASPTLVANVKNGRPAIRCVGASQQSLSRASTNLWAAGAYWMCGVVKSNAGANNCGVAGNTTASGGAAMFMNGVHRTALHAAVAGFDDGDPAGGVVELWTQTRAAGAKPKFYLNGVEQVLSGVATTLTDPGGTARISLGAVNGVGTTFDGDIHAMIFGRGVLDAVTQARLQAYLTRKWL